MKKKSKNDKVNEEELMYTIFNEGNFSELKKQQKKNEPFLKKNRFL